MPSTCTARRGGQPRRTSGRPGLLDASEGVYVGGWKPKRWSHLHYLRHDGPEHVLAFAPTRSGKGVSLVIPTLLAWNESAVIYDIKGENWAKTAGFRAKQGHICFRFCPVEQAYGSQVQSARRGSALHRPRCFRCPEYRRDSGPDAWRAYAVRSALAGHRSVDHLRHDPPRLLRGEDQRPDRLARGSDECVQQVDGLPRHVDRDGGVLPRPEGRSRVAGGNSSRSAPEGHRMPD